MTDADRLLAECLKLAPEEKARLIDELQAPLPPELGTVASEWPPEYQAEIARRVQSVREGTAQLIPGAEVLRDLKTRSR